MRKIKNRRRAKVNIPALIIISIVLFLVFQLLYFLQSNIFPMIPIAGIVPNLFVIFILVIGLYGNNFLAMFFGIICGIWIDASFRRGFRNNFCNVLLNRIYCHMV